METLQYSSSNTPRWSKATSSPLASHSSAFSRYQRLFLMESWDFQVTCIPSFGWSYWAERTWDTKLNLSQIGKALSTIWLRYWECHAHWLRQLFPTKGSSIRKLKYLSGQSSRQSKAKQKKSLFWLRSSLRKEKSRRGDRTTSTHGRWCCRRWNTKKWTDQTNICSNINHIFLMVLRTY